MDRFLKFNVTEYELNSVIVNGLNPGVSTISVSVLVSVVLKRTVAVVVHIID